MQYILLHLIIFQNIAKAGKFNQVFFYVDDLGLLLDIQATALLLPLLNRTEGENHMKESSWIKIG